VQRYLDALETADRMQPVEIEARTERLQEKIKKLATKLSSYAALNPNNRRYIAGRPCPEMQGQD
jgi:hypothetical protein